MYRYICWYNIGDIHVAFLLCIVYIMLYIPSLNYILYGRTMRSVQHLITLFASVHPIFSLLLLIVVCDCATTYDEKIILIGMLANNDMYNGCDE